MDRPVRELDHTSHLILHRTSKKEVREGISVIVKGESVLVYDQDGKRYLDLDAGVTRPVHVGHGSKNTNGDAVSMLLKIGGFVYYRTIRKWLQTLNAVTEPNCRCDWRRADRIRMTSFLVEDKSSQTIMSTTKQRPPLPQHPAA